MNMVPPRTLRVRGRTAGMGTHLPPTHLVLPFRFVCFSLFCTS